MNICAIVGIGKTSMFARAGAWVCRASMLGFLVLMVSACEAPLRLEGVDANLAEAIHRTDQFQAAATNGQSIVVVGDQGTVLTSSDQGASWTRVRLDGWPALIDVSACPNGSYAGLSPDGIVVTSTDEGMSWSAHPIETEEAPQEIACDAQDRIWVAGSFSSLFTSADGGQSWSLDSTEEDVIYSNLYFVDEKTAYVSGEFGTILRTDDAGKNWEPLPVLEDDFYPQDMYFTDADTGWMASLGGKIIHTADGGQSWSVEETGVSAPVYTLAELDGNMYAVGGEGILLKRVGNAWQRIEHGQDIRLFLRALLALPDGKILIGGRQGVLHILTANELPLGSKG